MRVYLASRYGRREELCGYRGILMAQGVEVGARWLDGEHQLTPVSQHLGNEGAALIESQGQGHDALRQWFALQDLEDIVACSTVISFTEPPGTKATRGGRHVEFGYALALGKRMMVVGPRENLFHWAPGVEVYATFEEARKAI